MYCRLHDGKREDENLMAIWMMVKTWIG